MNEAPMWHWRSKYSLGVSDIWATAWPPKIDSEPYRLYFMRWWKLVELRERVGHPGGAGFGDDIVEFGVAFEHAGEHQVPQRPGPPLDLEHEHCE